MHIHIIDIRHFLYVQRLFFTIDKIQFATKQIVHQYQTIVRKVAPKNIDIKIRLTRLNKKGINLQKEAKVH